MRKLLPVIAALSAFALFGCNTVAGAGKDVSTAGEAVTDVAQETKAKM